MCEFSPALEKVGRFISENPEYVMHHTISELADTLSTSEGSITRFCRALGFKGFVELRTALALGQGAVRHDDEREETKILSITRGTFSPLIRLSDWNLQTAVALTGQEAFGFSQIAGTMMVAERLLQTLEKQDERYSECKKAHQHRIFSIESVVNKLSEYFMR